MTIMMSDILAKKDLQEEENKLKYGDTKATTFKPEEYTAQEWQLRKAFESHGTEDSTYAGTIGMGDLSGFDV